MTRQGECLGECCVWRASSAPERGTRKAKSGFPGKVAFRGSGKVTSFNTTLALCLEPRANTQFRRMTLAWECGMNPYQHAAMSLPARPLEVQHLRPEVDVGDFYAPAVKASLALRRCMLTLAAAASKSSHATFESRHFLPLSWLP